MATENTIIDTTGKALCMGCCRLQPLSALIPDANDPPGLCPDCGGQTCRCGSCLDTVAALARGAWHRALRPSAATRAVSWSPIGGLVCAPVMPR